MSGFGRMRQASLRRELAAEQALAERLTGFVGLWVAVRNHEVVAAAMTLTELRERAPEDADVVFQVTSGPACFAAAPVAAAPETDDKR